jgi:hypothetical protein
MGSGGLIFHLPSFGRFHEFGGKVLNLFYFPDKTLGAKHQRKVISCFQGLENSFDEECSGGVAINQ